MPHSIPIHHGPNRPCPCHLDRMSNYCSERRLDVINTVLNIEHVLATPLTRSTGVERLEHDIDDPLRRQDVPGADRGGIARMEQRLVGYLDCLNSDCQGRKEYCAVGKRHTLDWNQAPRVEWDVHIEHAPHAIDHRAVYHTNRSVQITTQLGSGPCKVDDCAALLFVNLDCDLNLGN